MAAQDRLMRAYSRLKALRDAIASDTSPDFDLAYVDRFHEALDRIAVVGMDVDEFRIGPGSLSESASFGKYIERTMLLQHLDAVIGYFELVNTEPKREIGFRR